MKKKDVIKILNADLDQYYNIDDKLDDIKAKMTFTEEKEESKENFIFSKKPFILTAALSAVVLFGLGILGGSLINRDDSNFMYDSTFNKSLNLAKDYFIGNENIKNVKTKYVCNLSENAYLNIYQGQRNNNLLYIYQIYASYNSDLKFDLYKEKDLDQNPIILKSIIHKASITNTIDELDFSIQNNDIVYGNIYLGEDFIKNIVINF